MDTPLLPGAQRHIYLSFSFLLPEVVGLHLNNYMNKRVILPDVTAFFELI